MNATLKTAINYINPEYTHVLEFGVFTGTTIKQLREDLNDNYKIFGFDSFEGLPEDWVGTTLKKGFFSTNGEIPNVENVKFYKGWFSDTIPQYKIENDKPIALLHIDCDLYSSTIDVLYGLNDYIVKDTVIVFDEWYYNFHNSEENRQSEQVAFFEWIKTKNFEYIMYPELEPERQIIKLL